MEVKSSNVFESICILKVISSKHASKKKSLLVSYDGLVVLEKDTNATYVCIAFKYIKGFPLNKLLNDEKLTISQLKTILIHGIGVLHREGIIHRDIKCSNVIVEKETGKATLIDMSLACFINVKKEERLTEFCGSFHCMAPEMICREVPNYGLEFDWWSLGVLIYEIVFGNFIETRIPPFGYHPEENKYLLKKIRESPKTLDFSEPIISMYDAKDSSAEMEMIKSLIKELLNSNEKIRLGNKGDYVNVLSHPWFKIAK
ncbi:protein kinase domain-containing protein [Cryptosporidium felis]|nr:protein kinase domain-containing protein [Cryptosporidium felis]